MAAGIEADRESQVKHLVVGRFGVADHHAFARLVRTQFRGVKQRPAELMFGLLVEREVGLIAGVREDKVLGFVNRNHLLQQGPMLGGNIAETAAEAVGIEGPHATAVFPATQRGFTVPGSQEHFFMIAEDEHDVARVPQAEQQVDHRGRVAAAVDEIAQKHERVVGLRGDRLEQFFQGQQAAMHIAERDQPGGGVGGHGGEDEVRTGGGDRLRRDRWGEWPRPDRWRPTGIVAAPGEGMPISAGQRFKMLASRCGDRQTGLFSRHQCLPWFRIHWSAVRD